MQKWIIHHPCNLSTSDLQTLQCAYALVCTPQTLQAYYTLCAFSTLREGVFTSRDLAKHLNVFDHEVLHLVQSCVAIGLVSWYDNTHVVTLVLHQPYHIHELSQHPMLGRFLSVEDSLYLNALKIKYPPLNKDVKPTHFKFTYHHLVWNDEREVAFQQSQHSEPRNHDFFNPKLFLQLCEEIIFPASCRTPANLEVISNLGNTHLINEASMKKYIHAAMDYTSSQLDLVKLAQTIQVKHQVSGFKDVSYDQHHLSFFSALNQGRHIIAKDKELLEYLKAKYTFDQATFNYFIEVILTTSQGKFTRKYAEQIGESWIRAKINTLEQAKSYVASHHVPHAKRQPIAPLPEYYSQQEEDTDKEKLLKQLKEMDDEGS